MTHSSPANAELLDRLHNFVEAETKRWFNVGTRELESIEVSPAGNLVQEAIEAIGISAQSTGTTEALVAAHSAELDRLHKMQKEIGHCDRDKGWQGGRVSGLALAIEITKSGTGIRAQCALTDDQQYLLQRLADHHPGTPGLSYDTLKLYVESAAQAAKDVLAAFASPEHPSAPAVLGSLPSGESDPSVMLDCAGADTAILPQRMPQPLYVLHEKHLSGYRVVLGFDTLDDAYAAHNALAHTRPKLCPTEKIEGGQSIREFTDAELRNELHRRDMLFLGDQTVGVSFPSQVERPHDHNQN